MSCVERSPVTTLATLKSLSARRLASAERAREWRRGIFPPIFLPFRLPFGLLCGLLCGLLFGFAILPAHTVASAMSAQTTKAPAGPNRASVSNSGATITFRKIFKSSYPEFVEIKLQQNGMGTYDIRQLDDDASPQSFELSVPVAQKIFDLAAKPIIFRRGPGVHRRIANLGDKSISVRKWRRVSRSDIQLHARRHGNQLLNVFEGLSRCRNSTSPICSAPCAMTASG